MLNGNSKKTKVKREELSDEEIPLSRLSKKNRLSYADGDSVVESKNRKRSNKSQDTPQPAAKKVKKEKIDDKSKSNKSTTSVKSEIKSPKKEKKEEEEPLWEWWKEEKKDTGLKWNFLEHKGPMFAPEYDLLPSHVKFYYNGKPMKLSSDTEEIATFYAKMYDHEYTTKQAFNDNFMRDWKAVMTSEERSVITDLRKCDFKPMQEYFKQLIEERKAMSKEEKKKIKEKNDEIMKEYGFCMLDNYKQKIGNFKIEPPGLFRGRGNHPKMGTVKKRVQPEQVTINCSENSKIPKAPAGHKWKEVRHDKSVTWLAYWQENVQGNFKYVMLGATSRLKGEKDWKKYETARKLNGVVDKIRNDYIADFKNNLMQTRQRAVALYFIDKLALRAGNEKSEDEADTVGCCTLRYEHIITSEEVVGDHKKYYVEFDFLGKDSIRYQNKVEVPKQVFKNVKLFMKDKREGDKLFDRLTTTILNTYLSELMDGLTAKVFRTYNASKTLEEQLEIMTKNKDNKESKILSYNRANREVAILCNHQRAPPKTHEKTMENLQEKIKKKKDEIQEIKKEAKKVKDEYQKCKDAALRAKYDKMKNKLEKSKEMCQKLEIRATDREENKEIALGTSKLNYLDPRITIAWCKKHEIDFKKIYNKTQLQKFQWALDMTTKNYKFCDLNSDRDTNRLQQSNGGEDDDDEEEDDDE